MPNAPWGLPLSGRPCMHFQNKSRTFSPANQSHVNLLAYFGGRKKIFALPYILSSEKDTNLLLTATWCHFLQRNETVRWKGLVPQEITNKIPLLRPRRREPSGKAGAPNPTRLALPASHHHLDVLPLILFFLRGGIRLGRHDGTHRKSKAWSWRGLGRPPPQPGPGSAG